MSPTVKVEQVDLSILQAELHADFNRLKDDLWSVKYELKHIKNVTDQILAKLETLKEKVNDSRRK
jgi:archaellum component FlaC